MKLIYFLEDEKSFGIVTDLMWENLETIILKKKRLTEE